MKVKLLVAAAISSLALCSAAAYADDFDDNSTQAPLELADNTVSGAVGMSGTAGMGDSGASANTSVSGAGNMNGNSLPAVSGNASVGGSANTGSPDTVTGDDDY